MPGEMSFLKTSHLVFRGDGSSRQKSISGEAKDGWLSSAVGVTRYICRYICSFRKQRGSVDELAVSWGNLSRDFPGPSHETAPLLVGYSSSANASSSCLALG